MARQKNKNIVSKEGEPLRIDLGCGRNKKGPDWIGVDQYKMDGVDVVCKIGSEKWPFGDESVDEAHCAHLLEHLTNFNDKWERVHFFNELYRVMKQGAKCSIIVPHWCSNRYYGDPTHKEPISEMSFYYLSKEWRESQAPHTDKRWNPKGYDCHFAATWGYSMHPEIVNRSQDYQQMAMNFFKEACQDIHISLTKA